MGRKKKKKKKKSNLKIGNDKGGRGPHTQNI